MAGRQKSRINLRVSSAVVHTTTCIFVHFRCGQASRMFNGKALRSCHNRFMVAVHRPTVTCDFVTSFCLRRSKPSSKKGCKFRFETHAAPLLIASNNRPSHTLPAKKSLSELHKIRRVVPCQPAKPNSIEPIISSVMCTPLADRVW